MAESQPSSGALAGRSVAAATWGKKGVTAKQRQAALRSSRLEPLSADEYQRQQAMLGDSVANSAINSRRNSMDARVEHQFVRQHGLGGGTMGAGMGDADEAENEADMAPHSPLLSRTGGTGASAAPGAVPSVKRFWSSGNDAPIPAPSFDGGASMNAAQRAQAQEGPLTPPPNKQYISRPARSRKRGEHLGASGGVGVGDSGGAFSPADRDSTMQVTELLQGIKARQQAADALANPQPLSPERPANRQREEADEESQDVLRSAEKRRRDAATAAAADADADVGAEQSDPVVAPVPPPPASAPLCGPSCCPGLESLSCFSYLTHALSSLFGGGAADGRERALHEMRHGVILPQDSSRPNVAAVERVLSALPPEAVLNLRVSRTDELEPLAALVHPMVKLHVLDLRTGTYWRKKDPRRHAVAPYENMRGPGSAAAAGGKDADVGVRAQATLLPILTRPAPLRAAGSFLPNWDENLLVNEPLRNILRPEVLLLFEVLDFGPGVDLEAHPAGTVPVAWAFLKALNPRGEPNVGGKMRLQLYRYTDLGAANQWGMGLFNCAGVLGGGGGAGGAAGGSGGSVRDAAALQRADVPRVYYEWLWQKHTGRVLYPSTLYMGLGGVAAPVRESVRGARPTLPTQIEEGRVGFPELLASSSTAAALLADDGMGGGVAGALSRRERKQAVEHMTAFQRAALVRKRRMGDPCLLPTSPLHSISCGAQGCFALRFSPDGRTLAAACGDGLMFTLKLYDSDSGAQLHTFTGHHDLIHDLAWNCLGTALVTASADCTAKVWTVDATRQLPAHKLQANAAVTLQHTSFLYCAVWHPKLQSAHVVLTGGFDGVLRFWDTRPPSGAAVAAAAAVGGGGPAGGELLHSIQGEHSAHINSAVFAPNGTRIFTADAAGVVKIWEDTLYTRAGASDPPARAAAREASWSGRIRLLHTLAHPDLSGSVITCVRYHPRPERLLVYTRDNCAYVFSLLRYEMRSRISGVPCQQHALRCTISPDGSTLLAGGEDGSAYFFDLESGQLEAALDVGFRAPLFDVAWHPNQHAVALASFGGDYPIKVLEFRSGGPQSQAQSQGRGGGTARLEASSREGGTDPAATGSGALPVSSSLPPSLRAQAQAQAQTAAGVGGVAPSASGRRGGGASLAATRNFNYDEDEDDDGDDIGGGDSYRATAAGLGASKRVTFGRE